MEETSKGKYSRRKTAETLDEVDLHGRVQPQAREFEAALLGAMMLEQNAAGMVIDKVKPDMFYLKEHKIIYEAMMEIYRLNHPVDLLSVTGQLRKAKKLDAIGGSYYLATLTNNVSSSANVEYYATIINEKYILRQLITNSTEVISKAYDDSQDAFTLLDEAEAGLFGISENSVHKSGQTIGDLALKFGKDLELLRTQDVELRGVPSGYTELDHLTGGWQKGNLIILAARPGVGKTAFVLSMARNMVVDFHRPVAVFSLEMSADELVMRLVSGESKISQEKIKKARLDDMEMAQVQAALGTLSEAPLIIDNTPGLNIFELRAKCRRMKQQYNIECVIIDYLQLMTASTKEGRTNREQEVATISRSLKALAKELEIPVIALSQLSRNVENRSANDKTPQLSDLRESGAIEQDADIVMFIYRPEAHHIETFPDGSPSSGLAQLVVAKNRHGAQDNILLRFIKEQVRFANREVVSVGEAINGGNQVINIPSKGNYDNGNNDEMPF